MNKHIGILGLIATFIVFIKVIEKGSTSVKLHLTEIIYNIHDNYVYLYIILRFIFLLRFFSRKKYTCPVQCYDSLPLI